MTTRTASAFSAFWPGSLRWPGGEAPCAFGRSGLVAARLKREGDGATPAGKWAMRRVLHRADRLPLVVTRLALTALQPDMGWCDDPVSPFYNTPVRLPFEVSHEKLWREDGLYDLIVPLGYNDDPVVPGRGSAIFLHCAAPGLTPTEGCVTVAREALVEILKVAASGNALEIILPPD